MVHDEPLTPGVIDMEVEYALTNGGCYAFAIAMHNATKWPLIAVMGDRDKPALPDAKSAKLAIHVGVLHPNGNIVDIEGMHDIEDVHFFYEWNGWIGVEIKPCSLSEVEQWYVENEDLVTLELAETYVDPLLSRFGGRQAYQLHETIYG